MKTRSRTEVIIETHQLTIIRSGKNKRAWCEICESEVQMFTPEEAASLIQTKPRIVYRKVESGELHFVESENGQLLICSGSLVEEKEGQSISHKVW